MPDYLHEILQLRQELEAERREKEEAKAREQAERREKEEAKAREEAERRKNQRTTLEEYLYNCHFYLYSRMGTGRS